MINDDDEANDIFEEDNEDAFGSVINEYNKNAKNSKPKIPNEGQKNSAKKQKTLFNSTPKGEETKKKLSFHNIATHNSNSEGELSSKK